MELTPREEIEKRIERLQSYLRKDRVESCLILQNVDLFYFSGTIQRSYLFIPNDGDFFDFRVLEILAKPFKRDIPRLKDVYSVLLVGPVLP